MWRRGGRSSALDRAQALLSGKRTSGGEAESTQGPTAKTPTGAVGGYMKPTSAPQNTHMLLSDLSDLSSVSSASEHGVGVVGSADAEYHQKREEEPIKDPRPQSSLGGGGGGGGGVSRFLKKAPPPATNSSQSPVHRSQMKQVPEHRYVSSSQRGSQTAALRRLAQIENRIRSRKQAQEQEREGPTPAYNLTSDTGISPPPPPVASQSLEAPVPLSVQSSSEESQKGKRFLKSKAAVTVDGSDTFGFPKGSDVSVRSRSRAAADVSLPLEAKSVRIVSGVSLESDEEDMKKLLRNSLDSTDSLLRPERPSSRRSADKMLSRSSKKLHSTPPPPASVHPSSSSDAAPPRSPASPPRRGSPFRFTGQAQARFSPSVLSPSPPPSAPSSPRRTESPQRSFSSMSGHEEVLSLEELFPAVEPEAPCSEMSLVSSEDGQRGDFKINVMTLDDLVPASLGFPEETAAKKWEAKHVRTAPGSRIRHEQLPGLKEVREKEQQQEDEVDYRSDFESESRTEPDYSASQVSEHLLGGGEEEEEVLSEVREEGFESDMSHRRTEDDYSNTFTDTSRSCTSRTSDDSQRSLSRSSDSRSSRSSRSSGSRSDLDSSRLSRKRASAGKVLKETAVQTVQPDPLAYTWTSGMTAFGSAVGMTYMNPNPLTAHTISSETVEAFSTFNPAAYALNEILKQHLAMTRRFIESSRHLHSSQLRSLEPPNYRYITLEDTKEYIRKRTPPKLTMEEALEEVMQEMKDYSLCENQH